DVLHREEVRAAVLADLVAVDQVGVVEPEREARLVEKAGQRRVARLAPRALDHDQLVYAEDAARDRQVDLGLAAAAQLGEQPVPPERTTGVRRREAWLFAGSGCRHVAEPPLGIAKRYRNPPAPPTMQSRNPRGRVSADAPRRATGASGMTQLIAQSRGSGDHAAWRAPCSPPRSRNDDQARA